MGGVKCVILLGECQSITHVTVIGVPCDVRTSPSLTRYSHE